MKLSLLEQVALGILLLLIISACGEQPAKSPETISQQAPVVGQAAAPQLIQAGVPRQAVLPLEVDLQPLSPSKTTAVRAYVRGVTSGARLTYLWLRDGVEIEGQKEEALSGQHLIKGTLIAVKVVETTPEGIIREARSPARKVVNTPPQVLAVRIWPFPPTRNDDLLAHVTAVDPDEDPVKLAYQWEVNETPLPGVMGERLPKEHFRKGDIVTVVVVPYDGEGQGSRMRSQSASVRNASPMITSTAPGSQEVTTTYTYQVTAMDGDGDPLTFSLTSAPAGMTIDSEKGLVTWTLPENASGQHRVSVAVTDAEGSQALQEYILTIK